MYIPECIKMVTTPLVMHENLHHCIQDIIEIAIYKSMPKTLKYPKWYLSHSRSHNIIIVL